MLPEFITSLGLEALMSFWSLDLRLFSHPQIAPVLFLTCSFYRRMAPIRIAVLLGMMIMISRGLTKVLEFVQNVYGLLFIHLSFCSLFWGFIGNRTQFVRGGVGDGVSQPFLSFFSFKSVMSPFENI